MDLLYKDALRLSLRRLPNELDVDLNQVFGILEEANWLTKPIRQTLQMSSRTSYQNNCALMDWLQGKPYDVYLIFKDALEETRQLGCHMVLEDCERKAYMEKELKLYSNVKQTDGLLRNLKIVRENLMNKLHDKDVYRCNPSTKNKGLALVINNVNFLKLSTRTGSNIDRDNIKSLLEKLGYFVVVHNNLDHDKIVAEFENFKGLPGHKDADSAVVVILSHGMLGGIFGTDDQLVEQTCLNFDNCSALKGTPKLFFIQACREKPLLEQRATLSDSLMESDSAYVLATEEQLIQQFPSIVDDQESDGLEDVHIDADYLVAYSTTPGYVSWRNREKGSWFIQALCQVIAENAEKDHIVDLLVKVNNRIADAMGNHQTKQISQQTLSLRKKFYFHLTPTAEK